MDIWENWEVVERVEGGSKENSFKFILITIQNLLGCKTFQCHVKTNGRLGFQNTCHILLLMAYFYKTLFAYSAVFFKANKKNNQKHPFTLKEKKGPNRI